MTDKISRSDVDTLASKILVNFGVINAAALGASFAKPEFFTVASTPFALGLVFAVFSQILWYVNMALEEGFQEEELKNFAYRWSWLDVLSLIIVVISGASSGACIVYGCFRIMEFTSAQAVWSSIFLCIFPAVLLFAIAISLGLSARNEKEKTR